MPDLQLDRLSDSDAFLYVLAVILHPRDLEEQAKLFARLQNSQTSVAMRRGLQSATWRRDQAARQLTGHDKRDSDRTKGAAVATIMFMEALENGISLNKTYDEIHERHGVEKSTYWRYWCEFRPAAHLNAARIFWPELWRPDPPDLKSLLRIAEDLRRRGEAHRIPGSPRPLLKTAETWKVPEAIFLLL
jgi:hypothetical protein